MDSEIAAPVRTPSPVGSVVAAAGAIATVVTAPVNAFVYGVVALAASAVPNVPTVTVDNLPDLPNSSHRHGTVAYRIEQLDELERQLEAERERDGIPPSNTAWHLAWNPRRPLDFCPCGLLRPWLWFSNHRTRHIRFHDELERPENEGVGRYLERQVRFSPIPIDTFFQFLVETEAKRTPFTSRSRWFLAFEPGLPS